MAEEDYLREKLDILEKYEVDSEEDGEGPAEEQVDTVRACWSGSYNRLIYHLGQRVCQYS